PGPAPADTRRLVTGRSWARSPGCSIGGYTVVSVLNGNSGVAVYPAGTAPCNTWAIFRSCTAAPRAGGTSWCCAADDVVAWPAGGPCAGGGAGRPVTLSVTTAAAVAATASPEPAAVTRARRRADRRAMSSTSPLSRSGGAGMSSIRSQMSFTSFTTVLLGRSRLSSSDTHGLLRRSRLAFPDARVGPCRTLASGLVGRSRLASSDGRVQVDERSAEHGPAVAQAAGAHARDSTGR